MSENVNISFIPKKSLAHTKRVTYRSFLGVSILIPLAITFCIIGYAMWQYTQLATLKKDRNAKIEFLEDYERKLAQDGDTVRDIDELKSLIKQIEIAKNLLNKHIALTDLFNYIGTVTPSRLVSPEGTTQALNPVTYKSFSYTKGTDGVRITMTGQADSYTVLAALSQWYKRKTEERPATMLEYTLSGFSADKEGKIGFTLSALIDPARVSYIQLYGSNTEKQGVLQVSEPAVMVASSATSTENNNKTVR